MHYSFRPTHGRSMTTMTARPKSAYPNKYQVGPVKPKIQVRGEFGEAVLRKR